MYKSMNGGVVVPVSPGEKVSAIRFYLLHRRFPLRLLKKNKKNVDQVLQPISFFCGEGGGGVPVAGEKEVPGQLF